MADDLVERLRSYRPTNEWGDGVHHVICTEAAARIQALDDERLELLRANYAANRQLAEVTLHRNLEAALAEEREATEGRFMAQVAALQIALAEALRERTEARAEAANLRADLKQAEGRVKAITIAMHDAIRRPMGVVPETAEPFYQPALASDALLDRQGEGGGMSLNELTCAALGGLDMLFELPSRLFRRLASNKDSPTPPPVV